MLLAVLTASLPATAFAQEQGDETIEEIQVTATRRPAAVRDVSAALTIVHAEEIREVKLITDALAAQPGVFLQQTTPGQGAAIIRGLKGSELLHLVDGFRLNNAIFRNAPTQYLALVSPGGVQRIEVVRGAPASLYGSDAVGGVVQIVSRMPSFSTQGSRGNLHLGVDSADLGKRIRASYEAGNERLAASVSGEYLQTGNRKTGGGTRVGPSGYEASGARAVLQLNPREGQSWSIDLQYAEQPATPRYDELVAGFGQTEPSSSEFLFSPNERIFAHIRHSRENWLWSANWNFSAGWQKITDDRITRNFQSPLRRYEQNSSDLFGVTASAAREIERGAWVVGAEIYRDEVRSQRTEENIVNGQSQSLVSRFPDKSSVDQAAIYGNLQHYIGERHRISAGLRFSAIQVDIPDTGIVAAATVEQDDFSADLGWIYDLTDSSQLVANIGYGFRAPNVFDLGTLGDRPGNRFNIPNPNLQSERITQVDFGVRHRGERWDLDVMLFALHYTDRIVSTLTGAITPTGRDVVQSRNVSEADIYGVEAGFHYEVSMSVSADLILNYQRGEQDEAGGTTAPADRMPPFNGRFGIYYEAGESWSLEPYLVFAGGQDRLSPRDERDVRIDPNGTSGWITANVAASWRISDRWRLRAVIENILDEQYRVHGSGIDATGINVVLNVDMVW
ncbi:MAG: hemoglobin/transferrin/lactoferrin receptor protein [Woeseiaceae bacterium]|jgi:hemoglobin/transferrin/lactoferrin receptor protein